MVGPTLTVVGFEDGILSAILRSVQCYTGASSERFPLPIFDRRIALILVKQCKAILDFSTDQGFHVKESLEYLTGQVKETGIPKHLGTF